MTSPNFAHFDLKLHNPTFDSPLVDVVTELEHLRRLQLGGTTPPEVFFQLKQIFPPMFEGGLVGAIAVGKRYRGLARDGN